MTDRSIPSHYSHGMQPLDVMKEFMSGEAYKGFLVGNIVKYVMRYSYKDGINDIDKAIDYMNMLKDYLVSESGSEIEVSDSQKTIIKTESQKTKKENQLF